MASLLGRGYESSDGEDAPQTSATAAQPPLVGILAAPDVSLEDPMRLQMMLTKPTDTTIAYNVPYADLARELQGPANPFKSTDRASMKRKNVLTGHAEEIVISDATFTTQNRTFKSLGYAQNPSGNGFVGDLANAKRFKGIDTVQMRTSKEVSKAKRAMREDRGDASIVDGPGAYKGPFAAYKDDFRSLEGEPGEEDQLASDEEYEEEELDVPENAVAAIPPPSMSKSTSKTETTTFHGDSEHDYLGRTYMHVPQDLGINLTNDLPSDFQNFIPKKQIHTFISPPSTSTSTQTNKELPSHTGPITALRFFPRSGHLLLSASADTHIKIWDAYHERSLLRTFSGHTRSISDVTFHPHHGRTFLSASYDLQMKLWDTETGQCISRFSTGRIPHVVRFNPAHDADAGGNQFLVGTSDHKIICFDTRSGEKTQEYDHHLQAVNTITFCAPPDATDTDSKTLRFITTSDDKSLRAWEYDIPVPIKFISDPTHFPMTRAALHPSGRHVAFQRADNQIVVHKATDGFQMHKHKAFRGHNTAGYAIDLDVSPDGRFLMSGDSAGWVCFWDWNHARMLHKVRAGQGATTCCVWHPKETSKVATGGLDGVIRYWD